MRKILGTTERSFLTAPFSKDAQAPSCLQALHNQNACFRDLLECESDRNVFDFSSWVSMGYGWEVNHNHSFRKQIIMRKSDASLGYRYSCSGLVAYSSEALSFFARASCASWLCTFEEHKSVAFAIPSNRGAIYTKGNR